MAVGAGPPASVLFARQASPASPTADPSKGPAPPGPATFLPAASIPPDNAGSGPAQPADREGDPEREQGRVDRTFDPRPGDAEPRERQERHPVRRRDERLRRRQGKG